MHGTENLKYLFLLEAESTPGPKCGRKDCVNEKFQWHRRESNLRTSGLCLNQLRHRVFLKYTKYFSCSYLKLIFSLKFLL
jgi:hypothetical protein